MVQSSFFLRARCLPSAFGKSLQGASKHRSNGALHTPVARCQTQTSHHHGTCAPSQSRMYHSTPTVRQLVNSEAEKAKPTEEELNEDAETVPAWQNPLHHNNPEMKKMFDEDSTEGEKLPTNPLPPFETDPDKVVAPPHVHDLAHKIVNLTLLELKELTDKIANHFGFDNEVMAASYGGGAAVATSAAPQVEEKEEKVIFDLKLIGFDAKAKIKIIKEVRAIAGLGLKEAKELVESAPKVLQKDLKKDKADELKAQLEAVGAQVEIV